MGFTFRDALLLRTKQEEMVAVLHTNLLGSILTCRAALRSMLHTEGAAIVNIGAGVHDISIYLLISLFIQYKGRLRIHQTAIVIVMFPVKH